MAPLHDVSHTHIHTHRPFCSWPAASQQEVVGSGRSERRRACSTSFHFLLRPQRERPLHMQTGSFMSAGSLSHSLRRDTLQVAAQAWMSGGVTGRQHATNPQIFGLNSVFMSVDLKNSVLLNIYNQETQMCCLTRLCLHNSFRDRRRINNSSSVFFVQHLQHSSHLMSHDIAQTSGLTHTHTEWCKKWPLLSVIG